MTWRPSVGELVEVVHRDHFVIARVRDIERPGTRLERFLLIKDWGRPQFSAGYRLDELSQTGLRTNGYCKKGDTDPGS